MSARLGCLLRRFLFFISLLHGSTPVGEFALVYGHVLAQKVSTESSTHDSDISTAVQIARKSVLVRKSTVSVNLQSCNKSRLYYTWDGVSPYLLEQRFLISNQIILQRMHIVLGFLYIITLTSSEGHNSPRLRHDVTVTRDLNSDYHIFRHTYSAYPQLSSSCTNQTESHVHKHITSCSTTNQLHDTCTDSIGEEKPLGTTLQLFDSSLKSDKYLYEAQCPKHDMQWSPAHQDCRTVTRDSRERRGSLSTGRRLIRVATYNAWNLNSFEWEHYSDRMLRLGKMINSVELDILAVQEVRFEAGDHTHNQISQLATFLPDYQYIFQPSMLYMHRIDVRTEEGMAILSRYPILRTDYIFLYRNGSDEEDGHQRICLHAEILTPSLGKTHVFMTHLSLSPPSQEKSVVEVWRYMSQFTGDKLLLGDFNAEPHSPPIRFLRGELPLEGVSTEGLLQDAWLMAGHKSDDGFTYSTLTEKATKRIDYIFYQPSYSNNVTVINTTLLDDDDYCYSPCSDHYGVMATIG